MKFHVDEDRQISFAELPSAKGEPLALQFEAFLSSVETRAEPKLNGVAARRTLGRRNAPALSCCPNAIRSLQTEAVSIGSKSETPSVRKIP